MRRHVFVLPALVLILCQAPRAAAQTPPPANQTPPPAVEPTPMQTPPRVPAPAMTSADTAASPAPTDPALAPSAKWRTVPGKYAILDTQVGAIVIKLMPEAAPITVANFVGLATGTKEYTDPRTGAKRKSRYFDGQVFHRVVDGFMIQAGDSKGDGTGTPGYTFGDEITLDLVFDRPGRVAMANLGPGTNGSQFFITLSPQPHLNRKHTIFGQVVDGQKVANAIGKLKTNAKERPLNPVSFKVRIEDVK